MLFNIEDLRFNISFNSKPVFYFGDCFALKKISNIKPSILNINVGRAILFTDGSQFLCIQYSFIIISSIKTMVMKKHLLFTMLMLALLSAHAQNNQKPCSAPEARQFDFWIGDWDLYSADTITGHNSVYKVMDACTVQENFSNPAGYIGKSWSVYSPLSKQWQQTWVDNQGGYIPLTGKFEDGKMTLVTPTRNLPNGKTITSRMVYYNISKESFDWDWQASQDGGTTWKSSWLIHYVRKK